MASVSTTPHTGSHSCHSIDSVCAIILEAVKWHEYADSEILGHVESQLADGIVSELLALNIFVPYRGPFLPRVICPDEASSVVM